MEWHGKTMLRNVMVILSGPSSVGKSKLIKYYTENFTDLVHLVSVTTRKKRDLEQEGEAYYFVEEIDFEKMIDLNQFIFWKRSAWGAYYGISKRELMKITVTKGGLIDLDPDAYYFFRKKFQQNVIGIYLLPPDIRTIEERLQKRYSSYQNTSNVEFLSRLEMAQESMKQASNYDYVFVNDDITLSAKKINSIIYGKYKSS